MGIISWFKQRKCKHEYKFVRNIYGDEINWCGGYRSVWRCNKCGKIEYQKYLHTVLTILDNLNNLYDDYYKNKYESWQALRKETLDDILDEMINKSKHGICWADFVLLCEEEHNDKIYYEKWFKENKLECTIEIIGEESSECNQYKFHIRWKYL